MQQLPITEKEISDMTSSPVYAPILCADLAYLGIDTTTFIDFFRHSFQQMPWDMYDVKRKQWELLPEDIRHSGLHKFQDYYLNHEATFQKFADTLDLDLNTQSRLATIQPWRRRSVCTFKVQFEEELHIKRMFPQSFEQLTGLNDIRSLPRVFTETPATLAENELFFGFLKAIARYAQQITPHVDIQKMNITAHFMSVMARKGVPGNNAPEGAHEDGADFIVSALVINRENIRGGKSQVFEKMPDGTLVNIFERELQAGEFLFQADSGEEKHYGNDLWHYVTPFYTQPPAEEAWRDIIGLDLTIVQPKI